MERAKQGQEQQRKIAAGFIALRNKDGNLICETVSMNQNKQMTKGEQDLTFHLCNQIKNHFAKNNLNVFINQVDEKGYTLDTNQVTYAGAAQSQNQVAMAASVGTAEHQHATQR